MICRPCVEIIPRDQAEMLFKRDDFLHDFRQTIRHLAFDFLVGIRCSTVNKEPKVLLQLLTQKLRELYRVE